MEALIDFVARNLVDSPDEVRVTSREEDGVVHYELHVAPADVGKVIGRDGRTAGALRNLVGIAAARQDREVKLEIARDREAPRRGRGGRRGSEQSSSERSDDESSEESPSRRGDDGRAEHAASDRTGDGGSEQKPVGQPDDASSGSWRPAEDDRSSEGEDEA